MGGGGPPLWGGGGGGQRKNRAPDSRRHQPRRAAAPSTQGPDTKNEQKGHFVGRRGAQAGPLVRPVPEPPEAEQFPRAAPEGTGGGIEQNILFVQFWWQGLKRGRRRGGAVGLRRTPSSDACPASERAGDPYLI